MPDQALQVSIVIPARNEAGRLPVSIRKIRQTFPSDPWEFLIIIQTSTDETEIVAQEAIHGDPRFQIITNFGKGGKGKAVKTGMLRARGDIIFFMDTDLSVPLRFINEFLRLADAGDVLMGSRRHPKSIISIPQPWKREAAGRLFNWVLRLSGGTRFADTQCGFKAFRRKAAYEIFSRLEQDGFGFDVEALLLAEVLGFRVVEVPVEWADVSDSKLHFLDGARALIDAVLAVRRVRSKYQHICRNSE